MKPMWVNCLWYVHSHLHILSCIHNICCVNHSKRVFISCPSIRLMVITALTFHVIVKSKISSNLSYSPWETENVVASWKCDKKNEHNISLLAVTTICFTVHFVTDNLSASLLSSASFSSSSPNQASKMWRTFAFCVNVANQISQSPTLWNWIINARRTT